LSSLDKLMATLCDGPIGSVPGGCAGAGDLLVGLAEGRPVGRVRDGRAPADRAEPGGLAGGAGFVSGGTRSNIAYLAPWASFAPGVPDDVAILLQDAQTSGGLLLASSAPDALLSELAARDVPAAVIGHVTAGPAGRIAVRP